MFGLFGKSKDLRIAAEKQAQNLFGLGLKDQAEVGHAINEMTIYIRLNYSEVESLHQRSKFLQDAVKEDISKLLDVMGHEKLSSQEALGWFIGACVYLIYLECIFQRNDKALRIIGVAMTHVSRVSAELKGIRPTGEIPWPKTK